MDWFDCVPVKQVLKNEYKSSAQNALWDTAHAKKAAPKANTRW